MSGRAQVLKLTRIRVVLAALIAALSAYGCGESGPLASKAPFEIATGMGPVKESTGLVRGIWVINISDMELTNVRITVNGTYKKRTVSASLGGKTSTVKYNRALVPFSSFLDDEGNKLEIRGPSDISRVKVESDQGAWEGGLTPESVFQKHLAESKARGIGPSEPEQEPDK
jgi:hypothetical protein